MRGLVWFVTFAAAAAVVVVYALAGFQSVRLGVCRPVAAGDQRGVVGGVVWDIVDSLWRGRRKRWFVCVAGCLAIRAGSGGCARSGGLGSAARLDMVCREVERGQRGRFVRLMLEAFPPWRPSLVMELARPLSNYS
jgi:hypothetical protein